MLILAVQGEQAVRQDPRVLRQVVELDGELLEGVHQYRHRPAEVHVPRVARVETRVLAIDLEPYPRLEPVRHPRQLRSHLLSSKREGGRERERERERATRFQQAATAAPAAAAAAAKLLSLLSNSGGGVPGPAGGLLTYSTRTRAGYSYSSRDSSALLPLADSD